MSKRTSIALAAVLTLSFMVSFSAADDYKTYASMPGIAGDSKAAGFLNWIECTKLEYDIRGLPTPMALLSEPGQSGQGELTTKEVDRCSVALGKEVDRCSPKLASAFAGNTRFPSVKLALCNEAGETFLTLTLTGVMISELKQTGDSETLTLNFEKLEFKY